MNDLEQKVAETRQKFVCKKCNKVYNARNSLWYHEKKCNNEENYEIVDNEYVNNKKTDEPTDKEVIMMLIKENSELKNMMMKVIENGTYNTTHNNCHNKTFNLQFFLHLFSFNTPLFTK